MAPTSILLLLCLFLFSASEAKKARGRALPKEGLTLQYLYARIRSMERKFARSQQEMTKTQSLVKDLAGKVGQGGGGGGAQRAPAVSSRLKFSDLSPCPIRAEGYFYAPQFRSCYRLEARDLLINFTEAARTCQRHSPKADLVSIETKAEQEWLEDRWQAELGIGSLVRYWTSARRNNGKWSWEAVNKPLTYNKWIPSTDHNDDRFSCMSVFSNEAYNWGDVACWAPHLVMCELNL